MAGLYENTSPNRRKDEAADREWRDQLAEQTYERHKVEPSFPIVAEIKKIFEKRIHSEGPISAMLPAVAQRVYALANDPKVSLSEMGEVIQTDPALASRLLAMANSAFYQRGRAIESVADGVLRVGVEGIRTSILLPMLQAKLVRDEMSTTLWNHSRAVATLCPFIASLARVKPDLAYLAGLLHDVGRITLWLDSKHLFERYGSALHDAISYLHESVGGQLLKKWELPENIAIAVGQHHAPPENPESESDKVAHIIALADTILWGHDQGIEADPADIPSVKALKLRPTPVRALKKRIPSDS